jgi:hypothetical protein
MDATIIVQGRQLTTDDIQFIRDLISARPQSTRWAISRELCTIWKWQTLTGQLKDMACRAMLNKLDGRGLIALPPKVQESGKNKQTFFEFPLQSVESICVGLSELTPLRVRPVTARTPDAHLLHQLLSSHHYLGFRTNVGETIGYLVRDRYERLVACAIFGAAAWKTAPRDAFIGWNAELRAKRLSGIANNNRYLVLPWVKVPYLASHVLGLITRRIRNDWIEKYSHPVALLETFVDRSRFRGTCYRAANWQCVGQTQGRSRQDQYKTMRVPIKDIYLYPLTPKFREELKA